MSAPAASSIASLNSSPSHPASSPQCLSTPSARCTFATADNRRCTAFVFPGHSSLCHQHLRQLLNHLPQSEDVAFDILSSIHNFQSAAAINAALGKIFTLLAAGRIKRRDAIAMSYICQLLLQSLKGFEQEMGMTTYRNIWMGDLLGVLNARTPLSDFIFPAEPDQQPESDEARSEEPPQTDDSEESPEGGSSEEPTQEEQQQPERQELPKPCSAGNPVCTQAQISAFPPQQNPETDHGTLDQRKANDEVVPHAHTGSSALQGT